MSTPESITITLSVDELVALCEMRMVADPYPNSCNLEAADAALNRAAAAAGYEGGWVDAYHHPVLTHG